MQFFLIYHSDERVYVERSDEIGGRWKKIDKDESFFSSGLEKFQCAS